MFSSYPAEWRDLLQRFDVETRTVLAAIAHTHHAVLAQHFYSAMLTDSAASSLLSHEKVQTQLMDSMQRWIVQVLTTSDSDDFAELVKRQVQIGEVHARIDVPVHLVLRGARCLKDGILTCLEGHPPEMQARAMHLASNLIDQAMEVMSQGYVVFRDDNERSKEAYRVLTSTQNLATVREQRRAELLDWENHCVYLHAQGGGEQPQLLSSSEFGLWFLHKGVDAFQHAPETQLIAAAIQRIDAEILPLLAAAQGQNSAMQMDALRNEIRKIALNLDILFLQNKELEAGRDPLTHLFNEKFLSVVLAKEVQYARQSGSAFSLLLIHIDQFTEINQSCGLEGRNAVLQQTAALLGSNVRGGDYLFRLGEEEFLMVLVDTMRDGAVQLAEKLRVQIAREFFALPAHASGKLTVTVGGATFDGHPDYQRLLKRCDQALTQAKTEGGNRVLML